MYSGGRGVIKIICKKWAHCGENGTSAGIDVVDFLRGIPATPRGCKTRMLLTVEILIFDLVTRGEEKGEREGKRKRERERERERERQKVRDTTEPR